MDLLWPSHFNECHWIWLLLLSLFLCCAYQYVVKTWWYFDQNNVKYVRGIPLLGTLYWSILGRDNHAIAAQKLYQLFPNDRFFGIYKILGKPCYVLRDPKLIEKVSTTDSDHFVNHRKQSDKNCDQQTIQMRHMQALIAKCSKKFCNALKTDVGSETKVFEANSLLRRYANNRTDYATISSPDTVKSKLPPDRCIMLI